MRFVGAAASLEFFFEFGGRAALAAPTPWPPRRRLEPSASRIPRVLRGGRVSLRKQYVISPSLADGDDVKVASRRRRRSASPI